MQIDITKLLPSPEEILVESLGVLEASASPGGIISYNADPDWLVCQVLKRGRPVGRGSDGTGLITTDFLEGQTVLIKSLVFDRQRLYGSYAIVSPYDIAGVIL